MGPIPNLMPPAGCLVAFLVLAFIGLGAIIYGAIWLWQHIQITLI